jgi:hypothetical protein
MARLSRPRPRIRNRQSIALLIAGILIGAIAVSPVGAHVTSSFSHLWNKHIKPRADARYVNSKPRKQTINLNGFAFTTYEGGVAITRSDTRGASGLSGNDSIAANVSLPDGVTITRLACQFYDVSAGNDLRCLLRYGPRNQQSVSTVGSVDSSGEPGFQLVSTTNLNAAKVQSGKRVYWMQVGPIAGAWDGTDTAIKSVIISYREPAAR